MLTRNDSQESESVSMLLTLQGSLLRTALEKASHGDKLTAEQREELSLLLRGDELFIKRASTHDEAAKTKRAQIMLLGRDLRKALVNASRNGQLSGPDRRELQQWLYSTRRDQRRYLRRRIAYYLAYTLVIFVACLFVRPHIPIEGIKDHPLLMPFIISLAILIGAIVKDIYIDKNIDSALSDMKWVAEKTKEDVHDIIERNLRPRITALDSREKVLRAASDILLEAIQETRDHRFVIFIGAASLSTQKNLGRRDEDEDKMSLVEEYNMRLLNLEGARVPVRRYIALIDPDNPSKRRKETIKEYLLWLEKQISLLKSNSKYELVDCQRAQPWGGSRSSIITYKAFLDIVGEGESGFLIRGEEVARTLKESSEKLFEMVNQHSYNINSEGTIESLEAKKQQLKNKI